jgi:hypothetical protein
VAFVGGGGGGISWGVSLSFGAAATPGLAWFPLGPGEVWHPGWGGWSPHYYERVNQTVIVNNHNVNVTNINNIHNTYINYRAPGAVTAVPATAFVQGKPVAHFAQHVDPRQWRNVRFNPGAAGVAPVRQSFAPGLRPAAVHPPQALVARSVVATRTPATPAVYRDPLAAHLAKAGGKVPGAGAPVVRPTMPGSLAGRAPQINAREVRLVNTHSPVVTPTHGPANAAQRFSQPGMQPQPGQQPRAEAGPGQPSHMEAGPGQPPHAPAAGERAPAATQHLQPNNGVPRPPAINNPAQRETQAGARPAPAWTQPHAPITQQHGPMNEPRGQAQPRAEQPQAQMQPHVEQPNAQLQGQPHMESPHGQAQPQPHFEQARPQPQPQPHFEQPRPQPQPQPHFEQPRPQPQPQPHFEQPRPQPQPQPRPEPAPQQHPQHEQQHAAAPPHAGAEHHRG